MTSRVYKRRPRLPPFLLVESVGIGVTSSAKKCLELGTAMQKAEPTQASTIGAIIAVPVAQALTGEMGLLSYKEQTSFTYAADLDA